MKCRQNPLLLMEYAEGILRGEEARLLEEHLSSCARCRQEVYSWRQLEAALRAFPVEPEPAGFKGAVMRRIERAYDRSVQTGSGWLQLALGTGVSFLVVIVLGVAALWSMGLDSPALWALQQQAGVWLQLYLQDAYPNLLAAGWLLTGALVVAILGVVSSVPRRRRA